MEAMYVRSIFHRVFQLFQVLVKAERGAGRAVVGDVKVEDFRSRRRGMEQGACGPRRASPTETAALDLPVVGEMVIQLLGCDFWNKENLEL